MALFRFRTFTIEKIDSIASRLKYVSQTHPPFENPPGGGGGRGGGGSEVGLHLRWVNEVTYLSFVTILSTVTGPSEIHFKYSQRILTLFYNHRDSTHENGKPPVISVVRIRF